MRRILTFIKKCGILAGTYLMMFLIIFYSKELSTGIKNGVNISLNLLLPSMFIFMIFANAIMSSEAASIAAMPFRFLSKKIFKIKDDDIVIVVLSLVGGYPVGAKLLADEVRSGNMSRQTASRMLAFCVNCGPAFLISGVGAEIFGSLRFGVILYLSQIIACVLTGALSGIGLKPDSEAFIKTQKKNESGTVLIVNAVHSAIKSMAVICGFVVAFSAFLPVISLFLSDLSMPANYIIRGLLEVTTGCQSLSNFRDYNPAILAAVFTGFGGICVQIQVCAMLKGTGISMKPFFLWRIPYMIFSVFAVKGMLSLLPGVVQTFSIDHQIHHEVFSVSPIATAFLMLLCVMLLFFNEKSGTLKKIAEKRGTR